MTTRRESRARSQRLLLLVLAIIAPPTLMLVWLAARFVEADQALLEKHALDARRVAGQAAVAALDRLLTEAASSQDGFVSDAMVRFVVRPSAIEAQPADRVVWLPILRCRRGAVLVVFTGRNVFLFQWPTPANPADRC